MLKKSILWCIFGNFSHLLSEQRQPVFTKHLDKEFIAPSVKRFVKSFRVVYFCRECSLIKKIKTDNTTFWVLLSKTVEVLMQSKKCVSSQYTETNSMTKTQASYASPPSRICSIDSELPLLIWI